jgi:hypothetical protein|nr:MAG TPA: hypothetical protein [Caudoviricetes sp.]
MLFKYIGKNNERYTNGRYYYYVYCGIHWNSKDPVIWITYNDSPYKDDVDYACAFPLNEFIESFEI